MTMTVTPDFEGIPLNKGELPLNLFEGRFSLYANAYWSPDTGQAWVAVIRNTEVFDLYATGLYFTIPWFKVTTGTKRILLMLAALAGLDALYSDDDPEQMHVYHSSIQHRYNYGLLANNLMRRFPYTKPEALVFDVREQLGIPREKQMKQLLGGK